MSEVEKTQLKKRIKQLSIYLLVAVLGALISYLTNGRVQIPVPDPTNVFEEKKIVDDHKSDAQILELARMDALEAFQKADAAKLDDEPIYICGRTESIVETAQEQFQAKPWPIREIRWTVRREGFDGLSEEEVRAAFVNAWSSWSKSIDIIPVYTPNESDAHVSSRFGRIDGSGKVLAWSELSNGTVTQKHQLYDSTESWNRDERAASNRIDLDRVAAHEIGHVLGLVHDTPNSGALMAPAYSRAVRYPTERDVSRMISLGYKPPTKKDPPRKKDEPTGIIQVPAILNELDVVEALRKAGYKVER